MELDNDNDVNQENELLNPYNKSHSKLFKRCNKYLLKLCSGYHFNDKCIRRRTSSKLPVHSYIDYTSINNSVNNDKGDDDDDLNKTSNELKDNIQFI